MLHYFLNTYQAIINHIFGTLPQLQDETLDTTTLESSQGWSNYFPEDMINTIKASIENPNPWTLAILSGAACLGSSYYLYKSHQESLMMQEFKDQNDMARLLTFYENQFKTYFTTLGSFNNRLIFKISDTAIFQAIPYVVLNPHENQQDRLSKAIKDWMLEILSFVLLKRINVQELRCFIPINHLNIHWTSLNITINLSEEGQIAFEQIKEKFSTQFSVIDNFQVDYKC